MSGIWHLEFSSTKEIDLLEARSRLLTELCRLGSETGVLPYFKALRKGSRYARDVLVAILAMAMMIHDKDDDGADNDSAKAQTRTKTKTYNKEEKGRRGNRRW